jgi:hypothetical protein
MWIALAGLDKIANCPMLSVARRRWIERAQIDGEPIN